MNQNLRLAKWQEGRAKKLSRLYFGTRESLSAIDFAQTMRVGSQQVRNVGVFFALKAQNPSGYSFLLT